MTACLAFVALNQASIPLAEVPIELHGSQIWIRATLDGKPVQALVDTGAGLSVVDPAVADAAGAIRRRRQEFGGAGPFRVSGWAIDDLVLALGGKAIETFVAHTLPIANLSPDKAHPLGAILGYDFFRAYVVEIDFEAGRLRAFEAATFRPPVDMERLEIQFSNRIPTVEGLLQLPESDARNVTMAIDTGSAFGVDLAYDMVRREKLDKKFPKGRTRELAGGLGGAARTRAIGEVRGAVGQLPLVATARMFLSGNSTTGPGPRYDVTLGNEALRRYKLVFDYSRSVLYLKLQ